MVDAPAPAPGRWSPSRRWEPAFTVTEECRLADTGHRPELFFAWSTWAMIAILRIVAPLSWGRSYSGRVMITLSQLALPGRFNQLESFG